MDLGQGGAHDFSSRINRSHQGRCEGVPSSHTVAATPAQVRIHEDKVAEVVRQLVAGALSWEQVQAAYPAQAGAADEDA